MMQFLRFWFDFIIGDDWRVAAGVAASVLLSALIVHRDLNAWWVMAIGVGVTLAVSLWREAISRTMEKLHANTRTELAVMSVRQRRGD